MQYSGLRSLINGSYHHTVHCEQMVAIFTIFSCSIYNSLGIQGCYCGWCFIEQWDGPLFVCGIRSCFTVIGKSLSTKWQNTASPLPLAAGEATGVLLTNNSGRRETAPTTCFYGRSGAEKARIKNSDRAAVWLIMNALCQGIAKAPWSGMKSGPRQCWLWPTAPQGNAQLALASRPGGFQFAGTIESHCTPKTPCWRSCRFIYWAAYVVSSPDSRLCEQSSWTTVSQGGEACFAHFSSGRGSKITTKTEKPFPAGHLSHWCPHI